MSDKGRGTRVDKREAAWQTEAMLLSADLVNSEYVQHRRRFERGFDVGYDAGYEAAEAAERERIVAELGAAMKDESLMDAYDEGYNDGIVKAIEIVKGGEDA